MRSVVAFFVSRVYHVYLSYIHNITISLCISIGYTIGVEIKLKLRKIGNSMVISIPSQVVSDLKLKAGNEMLLDVKGSTIHIKKNGDQ